MGERVNSLRLYTSSFPDTILKVTSDYLAQLSLLKTSSKMITLCLVMVNTSSKLMIKTVTTSLGHGFVILPLQQFVLEQLGDHGLS